MDELTLTQDQSKAFSEFKEFLDSSDTFKTLAGYAGTGKTTLLDYFVRYAQEDKSLNVAVTATTNKAVKVLVSKVVSSDFMTIHSLLNIKLKEIGGKEVFEPVNWDKSDITNYDLVIIDECSMISLELLDLIKRQVKDSKTKVLFCGDPAQLQPINEEKSKCFDFNPSYLKEIIRHGDEIAQKSRLVRESTLVINQQDLYASPHIEPISNNKAKELFKGWKESPDKVRLLCWTNNSVIMWNRVLRTIDFGYTPELPYEVGDIVIANSPCHDVDGSTILMMNSEEATITDVHRTFDADILEVRLDSGRHTSLTVLRPDYVNEYNKELERLRQESFHDRRKWKDFYAYKKKYHDIRHAYAITCHKSQGSTFDKVVIDFRDISKNRDVLNRNQLLYVAMTRASEKVYIIE